MLRPLDPLLRRLAEEAGACAAVIWSRRHQSAVILAGHPKRLLSPGTTFSLPEETGGMIETEPARLARVVPTSLRLELPCVPGAAATFTLGDAGLVLVVVWCDEPATDGVVRDRLRATVSEISELAPVVSDARFNLAEIQRLGAVVNGLTEGVVSVDLQSGRASVNSAAAKLLRLTPGILTAADVADAMNALMERTLNRTEIVGISSALLRDPRSDLECVWRFPTQPTHLRVTSHSVRDEAFDGRIWVFTDESALLHALENAERAGAVLRATTDAMIDPQALVRAVREDSGRISDFSYVDVNAACCEYFGMSREQLLASTLLQTLPGLEGSGLLGHYVHCAETGRPVVLDDFRYHNEILADERRYDIRAAVAGDELISLTWRDVTDRFEVAQQVAESEERFRLLAENSGDLVTRVRAGRFVWLSPAADSVFGAPAQHWIGRHILETIPAEDQAQHVLIGRRLARGEPWVGRTRIKRADGSVHWAHMNAKPFYDSSHREDGITASLRLIDAEVAAEVELEEARRVQAEADARYRRLMDNASIGMCLVTPDGRFETVNQALCDFFGYDADTLRRKTWQEITAAEFLKTDLAEVEELLAGRSDSYRLVKQYVHADGHLIWGDLSVSCLRNAAGGVENLVSQIVDVTAEVEARRQISQRDEKNRVLTERLQEQTDRLVAELDSAARYVTSLLSGDLAGDPHIVSRYVPSQELAGDCYDYSWIDDDHLVVYLLDVAGHGVAPALVSISVHNMLRSAALPRATMLEPGALLAELNRNFPMERQGGHYFTIWYGVYRRSTRTLSYACAGHPPALLFCSAGEAPVELAADGMPVGMFDDTAFTPSSVVVPEGARLLLYSDGAYELAMKDDASWSLAEFVELCTELCAQRDRSAGWSLEALIDRLRTITPGGVFEDDCSLVKLSF